MRAIGLVLMWWTLASACTAVLWGVGMWLGRRYGVLRGPN